MWKNVISVLVTAGFVLTGVATVSVPTAEAESAHTITCCGSHVRDARLRPVETRRGPGSRPNCDNKDKDFTKGRKCDGRGDKGRNKGRCDQQQHERRHHNRHNRSL